MSETEPGSTFYTYFYTGFITFIYEYVSMLEFLTEDVSFDADEINSAIKLARYEILSEKKPEQIDMDFTPTESKPTHIKKPDATKEPEYVPVNKTIKEVLIKSKPMDTVLDHFATKSDIEKIKLIMSELLNLTLKDVKSNSRFFKEYMSGLRTLSEICRLRSVLEIRGTEENKLDQLLESENIEL